MWHTYIRLPRSLVHKILSADYHEKNLNRLYTLLLLECNYGNSRIPLNKGKYECQAGELVTSYRKIAGKLGMNKNIVGDLLKELQQEGRIAMEKIADGQKITVYNYLEITRKFIRHKNSPPPYKDLSAQEDPESTPDSLPESEKAISEEEEKRQKEYEEAIRRKMQTQNKIH
ncbi:MAG: hypothetical protein LUD15_05855 [Bacteroides sp.]|nr:hypothetical protein [Bacteroides sp.]